MIHVKIVMNNSVNIIIELALTELLYESSIQLFSTLNETNINNIRLSNVRNYINRITEFISIAKDNHITVKTIQIHNANRSRRSDSIYKVEDMIMLDFKNIRCCIMKKDHSVKLYFRFLDSFKIIKTEFRTLNYKLKLLFKIDFTSIHSNFHVNLLQSYISNDFEQFLRRESSKFNSIIPDDLKGAQYMIKQLLDHRSKRNSREYLIRWEGWNESHDQ